MGEPHLVGIDMAEKTRSLTDTILIEISFLLAPLRRLDSTGSVIGLMRDLGWELPGANLFTNGFPTIVAAIETLIQNIYTIGDASDSDDESKLLLALASSVYSTIDIITKGEGLLKDIKAELNAFPDFINQSGIATAKFPERLLDYLIFLYIQNQHPKIYGIFNLIGIVETERIESQHSWEPSPSYVLRRIYWNRFPDLLTDPLSVADQVYDWNRDKEFNSDLFLSRLDVVMKSFLLPGGLYKQDPAISSILKSSPGDSTEMRIPVYQTGTWPETFLETGLSLSPVPKLDAEKPKGLGITPYIAGIVNQKIEIGESLELDLSGVIGLDKGLGLVLRPPKEVEFITDLFSGNGNILPSYEFKATLKGKGNEPKERIILGSSDATALKLKGGSITFIAKRRDDTQDISIELSIKAITLQIAAGEGDGFIQKILPQEPIKLESALTLGFSQQQGFYFSGSSALEIHLPTHIVIGPISLDGLTIRIQFKDGKIPVALGADITGAFGPLVIVVENIGIISTFSFPSDHKGNLGAVQVDFGFKPPNGLGLSLDAAVIKGGGYLFFDFDKEEYAGALELTIANYISLKAIGLMTTRMPDGSKGFSLLIIITAEFSSGIQLGYGFSLNGVGGLLGLNRTMKLQPLMEGVRTGAVNNIMFPQDIIKNAPRIISDLRTIFPPYEGKFLIGPMLKIAWGGGSLITLSLGVIIEIPGNIAILGVIKIALAQDDMVLLLLQVSFAGAIEFDKKRLYFFASLFESRILEFPIDGDMGLLIAWGEDANFVHSVGGFHPKFNPPPLPFPSPTRISITILDESDARIQVMAYFAITSNTVQFGAKAELLFNYDVVRVQGFLAFDALIQFSPFYFIIEISSTVELKIGGMGLFSIRLRFSLEGPSPWRAKGTGSISLLFFSFEVGFDKTWGETQDTTLPPIDVIPLLKAELEKSINWVAEIPTSNNLLVSLRPPDTAIVRQAILEKVPQGERSAVDELLNALEQATNPDQISASKQGIVDKVPDADKDSVKALLDNLKSSSIVLHPLGTLRISQKAVPLDLTIDKVGNQKTKDARRFAINATAGGLQKKNDVMEQFAIAQYQEMDDASKISRPAFERVHGGVNLSAAGQDLNASKVVKRVVRYEQILIDTGFQPFVQNFMKFALGLFTHYLNGSSVTKSDLSSKINTQKNPFAEKIRTQEEAYTVVFRSNNQPINETATFTSQAMAHEYLRQAIAQDPNNMDAMQVIPQYEVPK